MPIHPLSMQVETTPPALAFLERLPKWLICVPLVLQWMLLALRYRSATLPALANPSITAGGLVGEGKQEYFAAAGAVARDAIAPWTCVRVEGDAVARLSVARRALGAAGLAFPLIAKPDIGWCGFGVRRVDDEAALADYLAAYPPGETVMLQAYVPWDGEAGIFYVREPGQPRGRITGLALRHAPTVTGDGHHTLAALIDGTPRLRRLSRDGLHDLPADVAGRLTSIPAAGETVRISTIGSTRVGGRYEDGVRFITAALESRIDAIARDLPAFHFGRFDLRYTSLEALVCGEGLRVIEINGAGSEAIEAWDPAHSPWAAFAIILRKQAALFRVAARQRRRHGSRPLSPLALLRLHLRQQRLIPRYPASN